MIPFLLLVEYPTEKMMTYPLSSLYDLSLVPQIMPHDPQTVKELLAGGWNVKTITACFPRSCVLTLQTLLL